MRRRPRVVAWGGREGDIQLGSREDRQRQMYLNQSVVIVRGMRAFSEAMQPTIVAASRAMRQFAEAMRTAGLA